MLRRDEHNIVTAQLRQVERLRVDLAVHLCVV